MKLDVLGEPAVQAILSSSTVREPGKQHRRDEAVAGLVVVIVGRGVITAGTHSGAGKSLKLNLAPHGPFRVAARAPPSLLATAPPSLRGTKGTPMSQPGGRRTGVSSRGAEGGQGGSAAADAGEPIGDGRSRALWRCRRTALGSQASGAALAEQDGASAQAEGSLG